MIKKRIVSVFTILSITLGSSQLSFADQNATHLTGENTGENRCEVTIYPQNIATGAGAALGFVGASAILANSSLGKKSGSELADFGLVVLAYGASIVGSYLLGNEVAKALHLPENHCAKWRESTDRMDKSVKEFVQNQELKLDTVQSKSAL